MRVGTRQADTLLLRSRRDHPHACGDKSENSCAGRKILGSSPCVWGQERIVIAVRQLLRIIPMRVGTRRFPLSHLSIIEDHPHACGDKLVV